MSPVATLTVDLHAAQARFIDSPALYRGFVGGRGAGKTYVGAYDILKRAKPGRLYLAVAPTYAMLRDASWRTLLELGRQLRFIADVNHSDLRVRLGNGAQIIFRSGDEPDRLRGPNLSGAWLDEASVMERGVYDVTIACLREGGEQGWLSATFTPKGRAHWTYQLFGQDSADTELVRSPTADNPFLPDGFSDTLRRQYTSLLAQQELSGEFVDMEGALFRRQWFPIADAAPADCKRVRYWDLAATEAKPGKDPDFTAGVLLGVKDGIYYVQDVRHLRASPLAVEAQIRQAAELDGRAIPVWVEQEPGSSGVNTIDHYTRRVLSGWNVRGDRVTGNKLERMAPLAAQAEAGNVRLVRGAWNSAYLDEAESIPQGHDDMLDATAGALQKLTRQGVGFG